MVGAAVPRESGGLVLAVESGFAILEDGKDMRMISDVEADIPGSRMNDGKCDSQGRFWAGTMDRETKEKGAALYRLDPNHELQTAVSNVTLSNGLGWSPDDTLMYYIDSMTRNVEVFRYDAATGRISDRRTVIEITDDGAVPDGMTADAEGFV